MGRSTPSPLVDLQILTAGVTLQLALQYFLMWRRRRENRAALWLGAWALTLVGALLANTWLFKAPPDQVEAAMSLRGILLVAAGTLLVPTAAAFAGLRVPRLGVAALVAMSAVRITLWHTTSLVYTHHVRADGTPVYGPLAMVLVVPYVALIFGLLVVLALRWRDAVERAIFGAGVTVGLGVVTLAITTSNHWLAELLIGFWILPTVVALQAVSVRRLVVADAAARQVALRDAAHAAELEATQRRTHMALSAARMGWYELWPMTGRVTTSPELDAILGVAPGCGPRSMREVIASTHHDDRSKIEAAGRSLTVCGPVEFRWVRPEGTTVWLELSSHVAATSPDSVDIVGVARDITHQKSTELEMVHRAAHDALTGLPNRAALLESLAAGLDSGTVFSLLLVDLDGFKDVNDTLGHAVGDKVLVAVAQRFRSTLRRDDVLVRLGGDEFAVMAFEPRNAARKVAEHLLAALAQPIDVDGIAVTVRASIGLVAAPEDGGDQQTLMRRADAAMYEAKRRGGAWHAHTPCDDGKAARRLQVAGQLPEALATQQIEVHYQPVLRLAHGDVAVVEALARWHHAQLGDVTPGEFVPLAEQYGLGLALFRHVLGAALAQCAEWRSAGLARAVAVNVSPQTLVEPAFVAVVATAVTAAAVPADALVIEVTENAFDGRVPELGDALVRLRDLGVGLAIDDFGAGYSSLAYLKHLPVDKIKLDRDFAAGLGTDAGDLAVVALMVDVAHRLGREVICEGVETAAALAALRRIGCDGVQGYGICPPAPGATVTEWLVGRWAAGRVLRLPRAYA